MVGIFDSGSGGLSIFKEIYKVLPEEKYVYYADNAHCPYGEKSKEYITDRCRFITDTLLGRGCEYIVVACNTATSAAIDTLRSEYSVPFVGLEPGIKPAINRTRSGVVGVLATKATLNGRKYLRAKESYKDEVRFAEHVGEGYVELVESLCLDGPEAEATVRKSLQPLLDEGADQIVLGCTHYPFLKDIIERIASPAAEVIDPSPAVARQLLRVMGRKADKKDIGSPWRPDIEMLSSGNPAALLKLFGALCQSGAQ